ncbi:MAG: ABC transporter permease [Desulfobulbaceae bacterium S3730MH12]|nr:MAG: ABC transporter permease [Desulfobulbaceae bacterium S3730MH12]OEU83339.1 MAG: ABC transporter permease [Desulfobulbaceae bacterium C00003063]
MQRYILSRLIQSFIMLVGVLFIVFFMLQLTGDPVALMVSRSASPEQIEELREELGFNRPVLVQFADFVGNAVKGDFGMSLRHNQPAMELILERMPATVELASIALLFAMVIGIPLGLLGGANPGSIWDMLARGAGLIGQTIPNFWLALILIMIFAVNLGWFPSFGRETYQFMGLALPTKSVILPAFALGLFTMGQLVRFTRSAVLEIKNEDFVRTAYSKGLADRRVYIKHILRNAAIPLISILGVQFGYLLSGSIYIETIFSWPGLGNLLAESIGNRDFALVQAIAFFTSLVVVSLNLTADIAYGMADPRIRYGE